LSKFNTEEDSASEASTGSLGLKDGSLGLKDSSLELKDSSLELQETCCLRLKMQKLFDFELFKYQYLICK
jgi:hypothetical protein